MSKNLCQQKLQTVLHVLVQGNLILCQKYFFVITHTHMFICPILRSYNSNLKETISLVKNLTLFKCNSIRQRILVVFWLKRLTIKCRQNAFYLNLFTNVQLTFQRYFKITLISFEHKIRHSQILTDRETTR